MAKEEQLKYKLLFIATENRVANLANGIEELISVLYGDKKKGIETAIHILEAMKEDNKD